MKNKLASYFEGARPTANSMQFNRASESTYEELTTAERGVLRARARWLKSNNPIMSNIDKSLVNNITRGMYIRMDKEQDRDFFDSWTDICDKTNRSNFYEMLDLLVETRFVDGESFIYLSYDREGLKLKIFEPEQLDESKGVNGLELDADGKVIAYWIYDNSMKEEFNGYANLDSKRVSADRILNFYRQERESQYRGVSEYARAIFDIKNMAAFMSTSIESMRARAGVAYAVKTESAPTSYGVNQEELQELNGAMVHYLNVGESISALDAPTTPINFREFVTTGMRTLCVSRQVSYEFGFRDFSDVNFTSSRAGKIEDNKTIDAEQLLVKNKLIIPLLKELYRVSYLMGLTNTMEVPNYSIIYPIREWVRPLEDLEYKLTLINQGLGTKESLSRQVTGESYESILIQRRAELEMEEKILGEYRMIEVDNERILLKDLKEKRLLEEANNENSQDENSKSQDMDEDEKKSKQKEVTDEN